MKACFRCKAEKEPAQFFKHHLTSDGLHSWCKSCCTAGNEKSRAKRNSTIEGRASVFLQNAKKSAAARGHIFSLVVSDIVDCWVSQDGFCAYSGREMTLEAGKLNTVSIERIDNSKGYESANTILVCQAINRMKSDFVFSEFYELCRDVAVFLGDENLNLALNVEQPK